MTLVWGPFADVPLPSLDYHAVCTCRAIIGCALLAPVPGYSSSTACQAAAAAFRTERQGMQRPDLLLASAPALKQVNTLSASSDTIETCIVLATLCWRLLPKAANVQADPDLQMLDTRSASLHGQHAKLSSEARCKVRDGLTGEPL